MVLLQQSKHALGSEASLTLVGVTEAVLQELFIDMWHEIGLFEHTFSRFLGDSELSNVNARSGLPTNVSPEFLQLCETARQLCIQTNGLYNPFILPQLQKAGYKSSWPAPDVDDGTPD